MFVRNIIDNGSVASRDAINRARRPAPAGR